MLIADLTSLAEEVGADIFDEYGTEFSVIINPTTVSDEYGGESESGTTESAEIPCILEYPSRDSQRVPVTAGQEYSDAVITMPAMYQGEAVVVEKDDRLKILEREGNNPERLFQAKRVNNHFGVYLQVEVVTE